MKLVVDSNVWISALVYGGNPRKLFEQIAQESHGLVTCAELFTEIRRILHQKFPDFATDFEKMAIVLSPFTQKVKLGSVSVAASRDKDDDFIIETAGIGNASFVVSGDKDLLSLKTYHQIQICTPKIFLEHLRQQPELR